MKQRIRRLLLALLVSLSLCSAFLFTYSTSAHAASGGGCWNSPDGAIGSCISISGSTVLPDAYIHPHNGICATYLYIEVDDYTAGGYVPKTYGNGCWLNHWNGLAMRATPGHEYFTWTYACYTSSYCEWQRSPSVFD